MTLLNNQFVSYMDLKKRIQTLKAVRKVNPNHNPGLLTEKFLQLKSELSLWIFTFLNQQEEAKHQIKMHLIKSNLILKTQLKFQLNQSNLPLKHQRKIKLTKLNLSLKHQLMIKPTMPQANLKY